MKKNGILAGQKGIALVMTLVFSIALALLVGYVMTMSYGQQRFTEQLTTKRVKPYYSAQAGVVEAYWRLRNNVSTPLGGDCDGTVLCNSAGNNFRNPAWPNPARTYYVAFDNVTNNDTITYPGPPANYDVAVTIGPMASGLRPITSRGRDV